MVKTKEKVILLNLLKIKIKYNILMDAGNIMNTCLIIAKKCGIMVTNGYKSMDGAITDIVMSLNGGVFTLHGFVQQNNVDVMLSIIDEIDEKQFVEEFINAFKPTTYRVVSFKRSTLSMKGEFSVFEMKKDEYVKVKESKKDSKDEEEQKE